MDDDLQKLEKRIQEAQRSSQTPSHDRLEPKTPIGKALHVGVELVAGVMVVAMLGLLIDWYFGTSPWGLIALFVLGSAAGMLNVYRALTKSQNKEDTGSQDG